MSTSSSPTRCRVPTRSSPTCPRPPPGRSCDACCARWTPSVPSRGDSRRLSLDLLCRLFHGGLSFYTDQISDKYNNTKRSRTNALLKNYFNQDGSSEILGKYSIPVIFAHLGHFGLLKVDYSSLQLISKRYSNVYFDTSGTSPQLISKIVEVVGAHRVVFGSDGLYNRILQNLIFVYRGLSRITDKKKFDQALINVLGHNFNRIISR